MQRPRFSMKQLAHTANSKLVIPEGYMELEKPEVIRETEKALYISFYYNAKTYSLWFARDFVIKDSCKYYCAQWIIDRQINNK